MVTARTPAARIGISGWRYTSWRGDFYPKGLRQRDELSYAAQRFGSIELNGSFYSLSFDAGVLDAFCATLPHSTADACE